MDLDLDLVLDLDLDLVLDFDFDLDPAASGRCCRASQHERKRGTDHRPVPR